LCCGLFTTSNLFRLLSQQQSTIKVSIAELEALCDNGSQQT
jgi:hypothetical protein